MTTKEAVQTLAGGRAGGMSSLVCKVVSVDTENFTIEAEPLNGDANLLDVRLQASNQNKGLILIPAVESFVMVTMLDKFTGFVTMFSDLDKTILVCDEILINGGENKGLVKIEALLEKINRLEDKMKNHQHISGSSGSPTTTDPSSNPPFTNTSLSDLENPKVKH